jgi:hypothetical protein
MWPDIWLEIWAPLNGIKFIPIDKS